MQVVARQIDQKREIIKEWPAFEASVLPEKGEIVFFGIDGPFKVKERQFLFLKEDSLGERPDANLIVEEIPHGLESSEKSKVTW